MGKANAEQKHSLAIKAIMGIKSKGILTGMKGIKEIRAIRLIRGEPFLCFFRVFSCNFVQFRVSNILSILSKSLLALLLLLSV